MIFLSKSIVVILFGFCGVFARISDDLKVKLPHGGVLVGRHLTSHSGRNIRGFLGIPYAKPPLNELRFKNPEPAPAWTGEKYVVNDSPICIQRDPFRRDFELQGSEDCLYLNVYTPSTSSMPQNLPVMVWFHGGGWECGSGISAFYGPDFLLDQDIIYVSGNFRLGPLGFLSTGTEDCPGNFGLKDQVEMLKWVKTNIASFGGNPNLVTIFGESAGGASVTYHMMSKLSAGLFHRGISQSGTYFNPWAQPAHDGVATARALKLSKLLDCNVQTWKEIIDCLRTKPAESITGAIYDFFEWDFDPMIPFPPVVEPNLPGAFITEHPRNKQVPHGLSVPWMAGMTSDEGALKTAPLLNIPGLLEDFKEKFSKVLPITLYYDHQPQQNLDEITREIDDFYFHGIHEWSKQNHQNLTNLFTDAWILNGLDEYLRQRLEQYGKNNVGSTYVYLFDHQGEASFTEIFNGGHDQFYGVCHAEELQYLFPVGKSLFISSIPSQKDVEIKETITRLWVNFAKFGNPTPKGDLRWQPTEGVPIKYARIGSKQVNNWKVLTNEKGYVEDRANFWRKLQAHHPIANLKDEL